jgi:NADPH:quinone reductase
VRGVLYRMAILARRPGGPEVLEWAEVDTPDPGPGEVLVHQTAIGVNFLNTYYRSGLYPWPEILLPTARAPGKPSRQGAGRRERRPSSPPPC